MIHSKNRSGRGEGAAQRRMHMYNLYMSYTHPRQIRTNGCESKKVTKKGVREGTKHRRLHPASTLLHRIGFSDQD